MERFFGLVGVFFPLACAYLMSSNRRSINWRPVFWGIGLQVTFAICILYGRVGNFSFGEVFFRLFDDFFTKLLAYSDKGADFIFASFVTDSVEAPMLNIAFRVLPTIIFFSAFMSILYHIGLMGLITSIFAKLMRKTMHTSAAETLCTSANIFVGQIEAPLIIKPFVKDLTQSELMAVMTGGFATIAGGVMAIYIRMLSDQVPNIAGHLLAASVMSAPAALAISKIMIPETETPVTVNIKQITIERTDSNLIEAASRGATEGMHLALNVAAMLVAFVALVALVNGILSIVDLSLEQLFGYLFAPFAILMGIPYSEALSAGALLGEKIVLTELIAYKNFAQQIPDDIFSKRSIIILSYALCGFSNFASVAIQIGGIGGIAPERRVDLAKIGLRSMIAGFLAANMTGTIVGLLMW